MSQNSGQHLVPRRSTSEAIGRIRIVAGLFKRTMQGWLGLSELDVSQPEEQRVALVSTAFLRVIVVCIVANVLLVGAIGHNRQTALFVASVIGIAALVLALRLIAKGNVRIGTWVGTLTPIAVAVFATWYVASLGAVQVLWAVVGVVYCTFVFGLYAGSLAAALAIVAFAAVGIGTAAGVLQPQMSPHPLNQWLGLVTPTLVLLLATGLTREALLKSTRLHLESSAEAAAEREERLRIARASAQNLQEEVHRRTDSLERVVKDLRTLNSLLSHDLSGGVSTIRTFSGVLMKTERDRLSEDGLRRLARVEENARGLQEMIAGLLAYSQMSALEPVFECVELGNVMCSIARDMEQRYPGVQISWSGGHLFADATMLRHILHNLVGNACKHACSDAGGQVAVTITSYPTEDVLCVADDGPGFDPSDAERIFELFERGSSEPRVEGHGVGLAVVRHLAERLGGTVRAESTADGARFYVSLPRAQSLAAASA